MSTLTSYSVRRYEPADQEEVLSLHETIYAKRLDPDQFAWKFLDNPYAEIAPMFVATKDGAIVGFQAYLPILLRAGERTFDGIVSTNAMVHPDHRGQGLYTRLLEYSTERCAEGFDVLIGFTNASSRSASERTGRSIVGPVSTYYRVQDPLRVATALSDRPLVRVLARVGRPLARGYLSLRRRTFRPSAEFDVRRERGISVDTLASLYRQDVPESIHAQQDKQFYRWQSRNPGWQAETYVALRDGRPVVGVVVRSEARSGGTVLTDAVPLVESETRSAAISSLLARISADHASSALISAPRMTFPDGPLVTHGFVPQTFPLLSRVSAPFVLVVRELSDTGLGEELTDESNWALSFALRDTN